MSASASATIAACSKSRPTCALLVDPVRWKLSAMIKGLSNLVGGPFGMHRNMQNGIGVSFYGGSRYIGLNPYRYYVYPVTLPQLMVPLTHLAFYRISHLITKQGRGKTKCNVTAILDHAPRHELPRQVEDIENLHKKVSLKYDERSKKNVNYNQKKAFSPVAKRFSAPTNVGRWFF